MMNKSIFILIIIIILLYYYAVSKQKHFVTDNTYFGDFPINKHEIFENGRIFVQICWNLGRFLWKIVGNRLKLV